MKKEELHEELDLFLIFAIFFILFFLFIYPTITGLTIYTTNSYNFTFENPNDYIYDSNSILIENNQAKLKLQEETYSWTTINVSEFYISNAYYNGVDKTEKIINVDDKKQNIVNTKTLDITFADNVKNEDIIALYLNTEATGDVYLCDISTFCDNNYGSVYFPNVEGWYNITIQNLPSPINTLSILTNNSIKVNYIKIIRETEETHYETNLTYPETSSLKTKNVNLPIINQNLLFSKEENLNEQELKYYYSNDNGVNWNLIENNILLSSQQIKLKAEFKSNTTSTSILNSMSLTYDTCEESWNCSEWSECYENQTKTRACIDINECGTFELKPSETQNCVYTPYCEENWACTEWSSCINENQTRTCNDFNFCNTTINKPEELQNCTIQETTTVVTAPSGGGGGGSSGGGSSTFIRPLNEKSTIKETTIPKTTPSEEKPAIKEESISQETTQPVEVEKTPLQKFTGFVSYNVGKEGINITLLAIIISLIGLLILRSKKNKFKKPKK